MFLSLFSAAGHSQDLGSLVNEYLAGYWKAHPAGAATPAGVHNLDRELEDLSPSAIQQEIQRNKDFLARLERWDEKSLTPEARVDRRLLSDHIHLTLLDLEERHSWKTRPQDYVLMLGNAVRSLTKRQFAAPGVRFRAAADRLKQFPKFLKQARMNLENPPELYTRRALELVPETVELLELGVANAAAEQGAEKKVLHHVQKESKPAAAALREFGRWLESDLLARSKGQAQLGADLYGRMFRYALSAEVTPAEVLAAAEKESRKRAPAKPSPARFEEGLQAHQKAVQEGREFVARKEVAPLPEPVRLRVDPAPRAAVSHAYLDAAGPFEPELGSFYYVPEQGGESPEITALRLAYPGQYVQQEALNRVPSVVRKVFPNAAFVAGWSHYAEQVMFEEGFRKDLRGAELQSQLERELDAILDIRLHTGSLTVQAAVEMGGEKRVREILLHPLVGASHYTGKLELLRLREDVRRLWGPAFVLREFHQRLLALGAPPVVLAREFLRSAAH